MLWFASCALEPCWWEDFLLPIRKVAENVNGALEVMQ